MVKRISLSLLAIAMVSLIVSAASFALFTAQGSNVDNTFTAGTVTLNNEVDLLVDITNMAPGDSGSAGTYSITYDGSLEAWLGLSTTTSGGLFTCDGGGHFSVSVMDQNANVYGGNAADQVVGLYNTGDVLTLSVDYALNIAAGNPCQAETAQLAMQVKAVQARNNTNALNNGPLSW